MDMIRTEYTQNMLVYTDVSTPIRVKWYRAHPKAKPIRPYTIFGASSRSGYKDPPLGEVSNLDLYIRGSWGNFGGYLGQNTCGPPGAFQRGLSIFAPSVPCKCKREMIVPFKEVPSGTIDGMNRNFGLTKMPISNDSVLVYVNGVAQKENQDYSLTGQVLRFTNGAQPRTTSTFWVQYWYFT